MPTEIIAFALMRIPFFVLFVFACGSAVVAVILVRKLKLGWNSGMVVWLGIIVLCCIVYKILGFLLALGIVVVAGVFVYTGIMKSRVKAQKS